MFTRKCNREKWRIITKHQNKRYMFLKMAYRLWKRAWRHEKGTGRHLKKGGRSALWKGPSWNTVWSNVNDGGRWYENNYYRIPSIRQERWKLIRPILVKFSNYEYRDLVKNRPRTQKELNSVYLNSCPWKSRSGGKNPYSKE
jgi:hypothetical protein